LRENVGSWRIHQWLLVFYLENSNRWITSKARLTLFPQYSRYNSEQSTQLLVCIMKLQLKTDWQQNCLWHL
jgi:hypothetical protein